MKMILIGDEASKRTTFMKKAAIQADISFQQISWDTLWNNFDLGQLKGAVVKIDPPSYKTVHLCHMEVLLEKYRTDLQKLKQAECQFLNTPDSILQLLDKKNAKVQLQDFGVPVTRMFEKDVQTVEELLDLMKEKRCYSVFVKPRYFSGAAGVVALRIHPIQEKMVAYTSCRMEKNDLVNTKKLSVLREKQEINLLLNKLLSLGCVVERWHPKAEIEGKSYDLRVVYQFRHIAHMVVRQSGGPITNLHLNNQAMKVENLGLGQDKIQEISQLCQQAMELFPGLHMAGIDILLEKGTLRPLIIEMNGQGDLIYQDIYGKNEIYLEQVKYLKERMEKGEG